jgi:hypothetical protein
MIKAMIAGLTFVILIGVGSMPAAIALEAGVDVGTAYYNWQEQTSCGTAEETGPIATLGGYISGVPDKRQPALRLRSDLEFFMGQVDYDTFYGACIASPHDTNYWGVKLEGSGGWRIAIGKHYLEPFLGFAYRTWQRDIESRAAQGYPEWYRTFYGRIGIRSSVKLSPGLTFKSAFSLDPMLAAREEVDWRSVAGFREKIHIKNGRRLGWSVQTGIQLNHLEVVAYWQATRLGKSHSVSCGSTTCFQPKSSQDVIGFKLGYLF